MYKYTLSLQKSVRSHASLESVNSIRGKGIKSLFPPTKQDYLIILPRHRLSNAILPKDTVETPVNKNSIKQIKLEKIKSSRDNERRLFQNAGFPRITNDHRMQLLANSDDLIITFGAPTLAFDLTTDNEFKIAKAEVEILRANISESQWIYFLEMLKDISRKAPMDFEAFTRDKTIDEIYNTLIQKDKNEKRIVRKRFLKWMSLTAVGLYTIFWSVQSCNI